MRTMVEIVEGMHRLLPPDTELPAIEPQDVSDEEYRRLRDRVDSRIRELLEKYPRAAKRTRRGH